MIICVCLNPLCLAILHFVRCLDLAATSVQIESPLRAPPAAKNLQRVTLSPSRFYDTF